MMQFGKILELTQLNLVQPAVQGYTCADKISDNNVTENRKNNVATHLYEKQTTEFTGNLSVVAVHPTSGNREIDYELVDVYKRQPLMRRRFITRHVPFS